MGWWKWLGLDAVVAASEGDEAKETKPEEDSKGAGGIALTATPAGVVGIGGAT